MTILVFFLILLVLVVIHEFGHFFAAKKMGVYVEEFAFGFPPKLIAKKIGETLYSFNLLPLGGFVKLYGEEYHEDKVAKKDKIPSSRAFVNKKPWQKTIIIIGGVLMNFALGWAIISYLFTTGIPTPNGVAIMQVQPNSPAAEQGLLKNDKLISLKSGNRTVTLNTTYDLVRATKSYADKEVVITYERNGQQNMVTVKPRSNPPKNQGALGIIINQLVETKKYPWYTAPFYGLVEAFNMTKQILFEVLRIPVQFITEQKTDVEFSGPVGIARVVGEARKIGFKAILELTALLSLNLAVINILPFPALDGGRLVFIAYEWITGKQSNANLEKYMNLAGIIILLSLSALITWFDIQRFFL
jgi:regulator of sigma E protease